MKYKFTNRTTVKGVSAETVVGELERIYASDGTLKPSRIVEEATPKEAVLHPAFEWRDKFAAKEYRLEQARRLTRAVHVVDEEDETKSAPLFVHVSASDEQKDGEDKSREGSYYPMSVITQRVDLFERALTDLERRMASAMQSVQALKDAANESPDADRLARVALAVRALETASDAIKSLH